MKNYCCLSNVLVFFAETSLPMYFVLLRPKNCSVEKLTATLNRFNKCYEWNVRENFLFNSDSSSSVPSLSLRNVVSSPFIFFLRLLQSKAQHYVPNFPIFLTAYNNYATKVVTPIWRRLNFAGFILCPSRHVLLDPVLFFRSVVPRANHWSLKKDWIEQPTRKNEVH